jgi:hypothetical protein
MPSLQAVQALSGYVEHCRATVGSVYAHETDPGALLYYLLSDPYTPAPDAAAYMATMLIVCDGHKGPAESLCDELHYFACAIKERRRRR